MNPTLPQGMTLSSPPTPSPIKSGGLPSGMTLNPVVSQPSSPEIPKTGANPFGLPSTGIVPDIVSKVGSDYANAIPNFLQAAASSKSSNPLIAVGEGALRSTASGLNTVFSPITRTVETFADALSNNPTVQKIASSDSSFGKILDIVGQAHNAITDWQSKNPELAKNLDSALTVGLSAVGEKPVTEAAKAAGTEAGAIASDVGTIAKNTAEPITKAASAVKNKAIEIASNQEKAAWQKPTETAGPGYKKAQAIYDAAASKGHDISDTLVKNGAKLSENVETTATGRKVYSTQDMADNLHSDAAKISNEMLRPALEKADATGEIPRTPVSDVINDSVKRIQKSNMTAEAKDRMVESLDQTKASLEKQYPEGMSLTDLHDEKINRDLNVKYSPVGDVATNMEATKNKAIADVARKMVEDKAPEGVPVHEFNAELAKQHQAARYLEALNGKTVPQSILSKVGRWAGKITGATVGGALGGGIMGELGGYHLGGIIESMIEKIPASMRGSILDNLKTSNPEAFDKVSNYLNNRSTSGSVAQPTSSTIKNMNSVIPESKAQFTPKSKTFQAIQSAAEKYKSIPNKEGGFVRIGGKTFREITEPTKREMIQAIDYLRIGKASPGIEDTVSRLAQKFNISEDMPNTKIANKFEDLIENTKTR